MRTVQDLQREIIQTETEIRHLHDRLGFLRSGLLEICDHSQTESYVWEHDNGYGRQTMITGKRCVFCLKVDRWNRGVFSL